MYSFPKRTEKGHNSYYDLEDGGGKGDNKNAVINRMFDGVVVKNSVIGHDVLIGKGSVIENSIIYSNCKLGNNVIIKNSVICKDSLVKDGRKLLNTVYSTSEDIQEDDK